MAQKGTEVKSDAHGIDDRFYYTKKKVSKTQYFSVFLASLIDQFGLRARCRSHDEAFLFLADPRMNFGTVESQQLPENEPDDRDGSRHVKSQRPTVIPLYRAQISRQRVSDYRTELCT